MQGVAQLDSPNGKRMLTVSRNLLESDLADSAAKMAALGDATRRQILELLVSGPNSVAEIADQLPVSRPAVSQHLRVLSEAGLVVHRTEGTRNIYQADPEGIDALRGYLDGLWENALQQFKAKAERPARATRRRR